MNVKKKIIGKMSWNVNRNVVFYAITVSCESLKPLWADGGASETKQRANLMCWYFFPLLLCGFLWSCFSEKCITIHASKLVAERRHDVYRILFYGRVLLLIFLQIETFAKNWESRGVVPSSFKKLWTIILCSKVMFFNHFINIHILVRQYLI